MMRKWIFFVLLAANAVFFGAMQLGAERGGESAMGHEALRADRVKLLGIHRTAPPTANAQAEATPAQGRSSAVCLEWGSFAGADVARAREALAALQLGEKVSERNVEGGRFWVYIPPTQSLQSAQKKASELDALGVQDYRLLQDDGKWKYALSLGVFSSEEAANRRLAELRAKGVKSAIVAAREAESRVSFLVRNAEDAIMAKLVTLKQAYPGSEVQAVECK
jgi:hypothetical protein